MNFREGNNYENQFVKFCFGERDHRRDSVGDLFASGLDDAGGDDEHDREYGSYGYEQVRLDAVTGRRIFRTYYLESVRGNIRVAFSDDL